MIKHDEELHISLRDPMRVKLTDRSVMIVALDGVMVAGVEGDARDGIAVDWPSPDHSIGMMTLAADAVYRRKIETVSDRSDGGSRETTYEVVEALKFRGKIYVSPSNIAGIVPQPFRKS